MSAAEPLKSADTVESVSNTNASAVAEVVQASDIDRIDPVAGRATLVSGTDVAILRLKSRQMFKMLRIITRGGATILEQFPISTEMSEEQFTTMLVGVLLFSIPEAENETIEFVYSMVEPVELTGNKKLDDPKYEALAKELQNPELDDLVTILETIARQEAADLRALGKRLMAIWKTVNPPKAQTNSSEVSPGPST